MSIPSWNHRSTIVPDCAFFTDASVSSPERHTINGEPPHYNDTSESGQRCHSRPFCTHQNNPGEGFDSPSSPAPFPTRQPHLHPNRSPWPRDMQALSSPIQPMSFGISPSEILCLGSFPTRYGSDPLSPLDDPFSLSPNSHATPSTQLGEPSQSPLFNVYACLYSSHFPSGHLLNSCFASMYELGTELGCGGYGFVMTARHRADGNGVAVKFIIKSKVPKDAWIDHGEVGRIPAEVLLLSFLEHDNIVRCLDVFEDSLYFYLVQELHGTPWLRPARNPLRQVNAAGYPPRAASLPYLSPCGSEHSSTEAGPYTPPQQCIPMDIADDLPSHVRDEPYSIPKHQAHLASEGQHPTSATLPCYSKIARPSHDLFECIEQSPHKRLGEEQARYIFAQVVEAVYYLDGLGITHRDIKDENLVIDRDLKVKLIDFGSAVIVDPDQPRPYYKVFYGTEAYASSEIVRGQMYQAAPAEIWTLGVLLSFLLTGTTCFLSRRDCIKGNIVLNGTTGASLSRDVLSLMRRCLEPDPRKRADIHEVRAHRWLNGALGRS